MQNIIMFIIQVFNDHQNQLTLWTKGMGIGSSSAATITELITV